MARLHQHKCGVKNHAIDYGCPAMNKAMKGLSLKEVIQLQTEHSKRLKHLNREQRAERHLDLEETLRDGDWGLAYE